MPSAARSFETDGLCVGAFALPGALATADCLLPQPRKVRLLPGALLLDRPLRFDLAETAAAMVRQSCQGAAQVLRRPSSSGQARSSVRTIHLRTAAVGAAGASAEQRYRLRILPESIELHAAGPAGLRYGLTTLQQLLLAGGEAIQAMDIDDWPDYPVRGVMLDISRCKVPTLATLRNLIDRLSAWKINHLQLYMEHAFAYSAHRRVWRGASPLTAPQVRELDAYCAARGIELAPNQNSFGHLERWLRHSPYSDLAESDGPYTTPWGEVRTVRTTLNPLHPGSLRLVASLYEELLPLFRSRLFNVGCDETWELGQGRSRQACLRRGLGQVYLSFLKKIHRLVRRHGRRMMFWADIAQQHPDLLPDLPDDVIPLIWGYEADHPFDAQCRTWAERGLPFYVCPGTSSWCSFGGRTSNCLANLRNAAAAGRRHGGVGYLITDWGDFGHRQYLPVSYLGFLYGAAVSWCGRSNEGLDVARALSRHAFNNADGDGGRLWCDLGRVHELSGIQRPNRTVLFDCLRFAADDPRAVEGLTRKTVRVMREAVEDLLARAARWRPGGTEGDLVKGELQATAVVLRHACRRAAYLLGGGRRRKTVAGRRRLAAEMRGIIDRHRRLWRARNRPGGLAESLSYFLRNLGEYEG